MDFKSLESEEWREYDFGGGNVVRIDAPEELNVSPSGGHRILDKAGLSHYVPKGWFHLTWKAKQGAPKFDF